MWWLSNSKEKGWRKIRFKTEFESWSLSEYLVGKNSVGFEISNWKESAILKRVILWAKWYRKLESQKLSLILKSLVMIRTLLILTSVSLRYFKANWDKSEYTLIKKKIDLWLKKEIHDKSLWLRMSFCKEKQRDEIWILI